MTETGTVPPAKPESVKPEPVKPNPVTAIKATVAAAPAPVAALKAAADPQAGSQTGQQNVLKTGPGHPRPRAMARPARAKARHWGLVMTFVLMVLVPVGASSWYLYTRAADQYASTLGFTVRSEDISSAADILGGLGSTLGGSGSRDTDILYEFIRSQEMVSRIDALVDLRGKYARPAATDPLLSFQPDGTIEDLNSFWRRMVRISYDAGAGLMELRVLAFDPADAEAIATAIRDESSRMINDLSAIAREDATRYAQQDLDLAVERLKTAREALTAFRVANQIVDVSADIQGQMGLLNTLQGQLATALIDYDLLASTAQDGDPRLLQAQLRIDVINQRIEEERQKFGAGGQGPAGASYAATVAEFESLTVDREFAEQAYLAALSAYDGARAQANRQSLYLAAYIQPTLAERSDFPQRGLMIAIVGLFSFLIWAIAGLVFYALRDSR